MALRETRLPRQLNSGRVSIRSAQGQGGERDFEPWAPPVNSLRNSFEGCRVPSQGARPDFFHCCWSPMPDAASSFCLFNGYGPTEASVNCALFEGAVGTLDVRVVSRRSRSAGPRPPTGSTCSTGGCRRPRGSCPIRSGNPRAALPHRQPRRRFQDESALGFLGRVDHAAPRPSCDPGRKIISSFLRETNSRTRPTPHRPPSREARWSPRRSSRSVTRKGKRPHAPGGAEEEARRSRSLSDSPRWLCGSRTAKTLLSFS